MEEEAEETESKGKDKDEKPRSGVTHLLKPYIGGFSGDQPVPKNESSFEEWSAEVQYLIDSKAYPECTVDQAIRNSLRSQARKVMYILKPQTTSREVKAKLESISGNVATGETVLQDQEFYNTTQKENESVTLLGIGLEEIYQRARKKGHASEDQRDRMLKNESWIGLRSLDLKSATRFLYLKDKASFEQLRTRVRATEYEMSHGTNNSAQNKESSQVKEEKKIDKDDNKNKYKEAKTEFRHLAQDIKQDSDTTILKDLVEKVEGETQK